MNMKNVIYYFTGTGNSLAVAKKIAAALGECELVPIASLRDTPAIAPDAERVGIVCPVYFLGLPLMVAEFAGPVRPFKRRVYLCRGHLWEAAANQRSGSLTG